MCCLRGAADNSSLSEPTKASFRPLGMPLMINKSDFRFAVVWFYHHSFDFRPNSTPLSPINIIYYAHKELSLTCVARDWTAHVPWKINLRAAYSWFDSPSARKWKYPPPTFCITKPIVINVEPLSLLRYMSRIHLTSTAYHLLSDRLLWWKETHFSELSISRFSTYIRKTRRIPRNGELAKMGSFNQSKRSDNKWYAVEVRWGIWRIFSFLREVVNIPTQTLIIPPWLFLRKMIISQLELGAPVNQEALTTLPMPSFSAANRGHTVGHYTRTSRGLADVKPRRQIICSPRL